MMKKFNYNKLDIREVVTKEYALIKGGLQLYVNGLKLHDVLIQKNKEIQDEFIRYLCGKESLFTIGSREFHTYCTYNELEERFTQLGFKLKEGFIPIEDEILYVCELEFPGDNENIFAIDSKSNFESSGNLSGYHCLMTKELIRRRFARDSENGNERLLVCEVSESMYRVYDNYLEEFKKRIEDSDKIEFNEKFINKLTN